jgi:hypothetical protein
MEELDEHLATDEGIQLSNRKESFDSGDLIGKKKFNDKPNVPH